MYDIKETLIAGSVDEALDMLCAHPDAHLIAGGTDVMIRMRERKLKDATLISIREIPELTGIRLENNGDLWIGPGTAFDTIYRDGTVRNTALHLAEACNEVGSPQIRHIATIGGNLCNGAVSADSVPSLLSLDAELVIRSKEGERTVAVTGFHTGPGKTVLGHEEILTGIRIRKENYEGYGGCYLKYGKRRAMEISTLGCAVTVRLTKEKDRIDDLRIAFGVAAPVPVRCRELEKTVKGMEVGEDLMRTIRDSVLAELSPRDSWRASLELREQIIRTYSVRAAQKAIERAKGGEDHV